MHNRFAFVNYFMFLLAGCIGVRRNRPDPPTAEEIIRLAREAREAAQDRATGDAAGACGRAVLC
jgi:hypothetical protein